MKEGWQRKRLGDLAVTVSTGPFGSSLHSSDYVTEGVPLVNPINIAGENIVPDESKLISEGTIMRLSNYVLEKGDVVVGRRGEIGRCAVVGPNESGWVCGTGCFFVRPLPSLDSHFLARLLKSPEYRKRLEESSTGATIKNLSNANLADLTIAVPPLDEQQRIVALLDEAFEALATAKANAEQNLQNARALFESHLESVFSQGGEGWAKKPLSELCDVKHGYAFEGEFFSSHGEYVLLTPGNFYERGGYRDRGEKQKYYIGEIPHDYILNEGDLLVAMTEQAAGLLGSPILAPESDRFLHNQRLGLVRSKPGVPWTNEFFFHVFNTQSVRQSIHASASGVKVRHTSPSKLGDVVVAFPTSLDEQRSIVSLLASLQSETKHLTHLYERKLAALEELKTSLLHQAFNGEL